MHRFVLRKYYEFLSNKSVDYIQISESDMESIKEHSKDKDLIFNKSMFLLGTLLEEKKTTNNSSKIERLYISGIGGPSASNVINRFTQYSYDFQKLAKNITESEENDITNCIYADIVHVPDDRTANIVSRSISRHYEIEYLGKSGLPRDNVISVNDILVSINSENKILLRNKIDNKLIIPRLSNAHNFSGSSLPVYKFLCDIQSDGYSRPNIWDWGGLNEFNYLPKVQYKNLIIKRARWIINETDLHVKEDIFNPSALYDFRLKMNLPRKALIIQGDQELVIEFNSDENNYNFFRSMLAKYKTLIIEEFLFEKFDSALKNMEGESIAHELVIPFEKKNINNTSHPSHPLQPITESIQRKFLPDSEWSYYKIYAGPKMLDKLISSTDFSSRKGFSFGTFFLWINFS